MTIIKIPNEQPDHYEPKKQVYYVEEIKFIELVSRYLKLEARVAEIEKRIQGTSEEQLRQHEPGMSVCSAEPVQIDCMLDGLDPS